MKVWRALLLLLVLTAGTAVAAGAQNLPFQLLAFGCVDIDASHPLALEFERETFPPFTDTGLFTVDGEQLLFTEQGRLTIVSNELGQTLASSGFSYLASPGGALGVRNDDLVDASLLWLRLTDPFNSGQATRFAAPGAFRSLRATIRADIQSPQPLFTELKLPRTMKGRSYLFIARLDLSPQAVIDLGASNEPLTTNGVTALVVDAGSLQFDHPTQQNLFSGEAMLLEPSGLHVQNPNGESAIAFLIGLVPLDDMGLVETAISATPDSNQECP
jgi:hypothetical protein